MQFSKSNKGDISLIFFYQSYFVTFLINTFISEYHKKDYNDNNENNEKQGQTVVHKNVN